MCRQVLVHSLFTAIHGASRSDVVPRAYLLVASPSAAIRCADDLCRCREQQNASLFVTLMKLEHRRVARSCCLNGGPARS